MGVRSLASGFTRGGKVAKQNMVLFPRWTFQEEDRIINKAVVPVVLPGVVEDAQKRIIRTLTILPHELQFLLPGIGLYIHIPS